METLVDNKLNQFQVMDWGLIDYQDSNVKQQELIQKIYDNKQVGKIIFCSHAPVVTVGRATKDNDLCGWQGRVINSPRGGRATYHGPNQLVIYPLVNLSYENYVSFRKKDITTYLRLLEKVVINTLKHFKIEAYQRCEKININGEQLEATGVWVADKKIASIGIAARRWVTYHGIAINIFEDDQAFSGIKPCGFSASTMTSMQAISGSKIEISELKKVFVAEFKQLIN